MKLILAILTLGFAFFTGCMDTESILTPGEMQLNEKSAGPNWITLPHRTGSKVETQYYTITKQIDGASGGDLEIKEEYLGGPFGKVKVKVKLKFKKDSFPGTESITMLVDTYTGTVTYSPHMNFNVPAELEMDYEGMDLNGINPDSVTFVYLRPDGYYDTMVYDKITVSPGNGKIHLKKGRVPHFSRYGFSR